ncbi:MAG: ABC transporter substrate-binding protein [Dehalococcoidia bacterium]
MVAVLSTPTRQSSLDCQVTGSATVNHRPSVEFMLAVDNNTGEIIPSLATEWSITPDGRTWNFKLRKDVPFHFDMGEFSADDVVNSMAYYTNEECKASYSDFFRNNPGADLEVIDDFEINMHMRERAAVNFDYWLSEYRGVPMSSAQQWNQACPGGSAEYERGYCVASTPQVEAKPARTGPYQFVSFEKGVNWEYERVAYDHWRVQPDFPELEIKMVKEPATRLAILLAREGHLGAVPRALNQEALDGGLEVLDASVEAITAFMLFGGAYFEKSLAAEYDPTVPWATPGEIGRKVRMAMNKALDRDLINEAIFDGQGSKQWVATLHPAFPAGYNPEWEDKWEELYGYDPERAKELLDEAGFSDGFAFPIKVFRLSGVPEMPDYMEASAAMWEAIGLQPKLEEIEFQRMRELYRGAQTQGMIYPFRGPAAPIDTRVHFYFSAERFFRAPATDTIQATKDIALNSIDRDAANVLWQEVADELFDEVHTMPLFTLPVQAIVDPEVVSQYVWLGVPGGNYTALEYVKAVRK